MKKKKKDGRNRRKKRGKRNRGEKGEGRHTRARGTRRSGAVLDAGDGGGASACCQRNLRRCLLKGGSAYYRCRREPMLFSIIDTINDRRVPAPFLCGLPVINKRIAFFPFQHTPCTPPFLEGPYRQRIVPSLPNVRACAPATCGGQC